MTDRATESSSEILRQVRRIEIKTRGLSNDIFAGKYHSAFNGRAWPSARCASTAWATMSADIDWNVTARSMKSHIKVYEEETRTDECAAGGRQRFAHVRYDRPSQEKIRSPKSPPCLAFSAAQNNDKVGCIFFSDRVEKFIPPKKGRSHVLTIIKELIGFRPESGGTDLAEGLRCLTNVLKKRSTAFVLSDFLDTTATGPISRMR